MGYIFHFSSFRIFYAWMFVDSLFREYLVLFLFVPIIIIFITAAIGTGWDNIIMLLLQRPKQCLQIGSLSRWHHYNVLIIFSLITSAYPARGFWAFAAEYSLHCSYTWYYHIISVPMSSSCNVSRSNELSNRLFRWSLNRPGRNIMRQN